MSSPSLDEELLTGYIDNLGSNIVKQMIELYVEQSNLYLVDIAKNVDENSQSQWQESCHKMKGAAGSVGLKKVHALLVNIEKLTVSTEKKLLLLSELKQLNQSGITAFKQWLNA